MAVAELEVSERDFVMARLAAARASCANSLNAIDEALALFIEPADDEDGEERIELIEIALESAGATARALESAQAEMPNVDPEEIEPWEDDQDEDEDDDHVAELPRATARKKKAKK